VNRELSPPPSERQIRAALEPCSEGAIVALVHSKVPTIQARREFENARRTLNHDSLVVLAAETLARATAPPTRGPPPVSPG
jgi:hypothetical protein